MQKNTVKINFLKIKEVKAEQVICINKTGDYAKACMQSWTELMNFIQDKKLINEKTKFLGLYYDDPKTVSEKNLRSSACITCEKEIDLPENIEKKEIFGGKYAVFHHQGPYELLMDVYTEIYNNWLPENKQTPKIGPCIENYLNNPQETKPEDLKTELYIPIV